MDAKRFARLQEVFAAARGLTGAEQVAYLDAACGDDPELRRDVDELLGEDAQPGSAVVDRALADDAPIAAEPEPAPLRQIGRYRIHRVCGEGGMGVVYEAEDAGRRVALKVIRSGNLRPELLRRFRRETEILARLEHPGIARVFEASEVETEGGRIPFFAMEFVEGLPPHEFAQRHALSVLARIDVFLQVCDAIDYAHQRGVVHRDLKPDNILVVEPGRPKVLDFGVAGLVDADTHVTMVTGAGQLLGSVPYMSPEQAVGDTRAIGPQSDVYSLGVLLFELLVGRLPYDVREGALVDALHTVRHAEPTRLGAVDPALRGDLETIVGKCLEKDIARRYESVAAMAEDLRRFSERQPILARAPSTWFQLRRFAARNRVLVGGAATTALALLVGAVVAVIFAVAAGRAEDMALENQRRSDRKAYQANLEAASALLESDPAHARRILEQIPAAMRGWEWRYLAAARAGGVLTFGEVRPHPQRPSAFWANEEMFLLAGGDRVVAPVSATRFGIWETRTGRAVRTFDAPAAIGVWGVAAGGGLLAAALADGRIVTMDPNVEPVRWSTWHTSTSPVHAIAVDPSGQRIAMHHDDEIRVGRVDAWRVIPVSARAVVAPPLLEFRGDGEQLAILHEARLVVRDVRTGDALGEPMPSTQDHVAIAFLSDGRLASGQVRREIRLYDPATGGYAVELLGHEKSILDLAAGPNGRLLSVSSDDTIRVWDLDRREPIAIFDAPGTVKAEFVDADHVLSLTDGRLRLWTLRQRRARQLEGHDDHVFSVAFSGDGELLASVAPWGETLLWDPLESEPLCRLPKEPRHQSITFDRSGERVLSSHDWWGERAMAIRSWPEGAASLVIPERPRVVQGMVSGRLHVDGAEAEAVAAKGAGLRVFRTEHCALGDGAAQAFVDGRRVELRPVESPRAARAASAGKNPLLTIGQQLGSCFDGAIAEFVVFAGGLSPAAGAAIDGYLAARRDGREVELPAFEAEGGVRLLLHFRAGADSVRLNDDGQVVAWIAANDERRMLSAHGSFSGVSLLPATDSTPACVKLWAGWAQSRWLETALPEAAGVDRLTVCWLGEVPPKGWQLAYAIGSRAMGYPHRVDDERIAHRCRRIAYSADGKLVATSGGADHYGNVDVWDAVTGHSVAVFHGQYNGIGFHPDSIRLAAGDEHGRVDVFDVRTGQRVARIQAHGSAVSSTPCFDVAFSPDGTRLASGGNDNALRLWDATTYERLIEFPGHRSYVMGVAWSPDSTMLVSACGDYRVRVWDSVPPNERYRERLARRALEDEVRPQVVSIHRAAANSEDALAKLRELWPAGSSRRRAACRVFVRLQ
ncbi:MAG: serine/threonine-protein kinase [bacterium]|nr:serine/threonine-protein kinase [bacterium]